LDFICANDVAAADPGFQSIRNRVTIIDKSGKMEELPLMSKRDVADKILDKIVGLLKKGKNKLSSGMTIRPYRLMTK